MNTAMALLDAGAVLPTGTAVGEDTDTVDTLTSRVYAHPVLAERVVVRLVPGALGSAEDLAMDFLHFAAPSQVTEVGLVRQQALGFPAWALVHDPANGHHALALVKEIERLARVAKSRIGPAKQGFDALGERLARSVPHFLPTFFEQAGRIFLTADSPTYAATMFGKAREAERVFALTIDEERQHTVFLEFALAGALTAKALSGHARDLAARCEPAAAYERFRRLCVERTLGGMPPYAAMHTDLRRLARAAKLDQATADQAVLRELLAAPALNRAPEAFWTAYQESLIKLAVTEPGLRGQLLGMFPKNCADETWLTLLAATGATAALTEPADSVPAIAQSPDGPAGWLSRFVAHREQRYWRRQARLPMLLDLVVRMAGRLIADAVPVAMCRRYDDVDLDLLDLCLALGVALSEPDPTARYHVDRWLADDTEGRRDLMAVAADERLRAPIAASVESILSPSWRSTDKVNLTMVRAVVAVPGLRHAMHAWLDELADKVRGEGLPTLGRQLDRVRLLACPEGLSINPTAVRRIAEVDLAPVLARTLRAGVLDEYGWPALEAAVARLGEVAAKKNEKIVTVDQWPHLILRRGDLVLVVGPERIELEHLIRVPAKERDYLWRLVLRYVDGQLLVCWDRGPDRAGYWSGAADDVFVVDDDAFTVNAALSLPLPGGGRTAGGRPLYPGDRGEQVRGKIASDGVSYWVLRADDENRSDWYEYDPATGQLGRACRPAFFEQGVVDGEPVDWSRCWLRPGPNAAGNPLGGGDLIGWRVRAAGDRGTMGESLDGRAFALRADPAQSSALVAALRFPAATATYGLAWSNQWRDEQALIVDSDGFVLGKYKMDGERSRFARGTALVPPLAYWSQLRPRDLDGSAALRALSGEQAIALLAGAAGRSGKEIRAIIPELVPQLRDESLAAGVAGVVKVAARHAAALVEFGAILDGLVTVGPGEPAPAEQHSDTVTSDALLVAALEGLMPYCYQRGSSAMTLIAQAGAALTGKADGVSMVGKADGASIIGKADVDWFDVLGALPAAMYRAAAAYTGAEHRQTLLALLATVAESGLTTPGSRLRRATLRAERQTTRRLGEVITVERRRLLVLSVDDDERQVEVLEYAPDGGFGPVPGFTITTERVLDTSAAAPEVLTAVANRVTAHPAPWPTVTLVGSLSHRAGISYAEAASVLAGLPPRADDDRAEAIQYRTDLAVGEAAWGLATSTHNAGDHRLRADLLARLLPEDPVALWRDGPAIDRIADWLEQRRGARVPVADELIVMVGQQRRANLIGASELLHGLTNPTTCRWLIGADHGLEAGRLLRTLAWALPWLAYHLPDRSPVRAALPTALRLARQRLADPGFAVRIGYLDADDLDSFAAVSGLTRTDGPQGIELGPLLFPPDSGWRKVLLRTAGLSGADDPALALVRAKLDSCDEEIVGAVRTLLGGQLDPLVADDGADHGTGCAHDPAQSAPELVAQASAALGVGADAATLYLQLLALPDPTDRNVARWTGWQPARLKAARAELAATDLVVAAKRPRAGRSLFLPGGWLALKAPHLPLERWKLPLLIGGESGVTDLDLVLPATRVPGLFGLAWARVQQGDAPRFDELVLERRR